MFNIRNYRPLVITMAVQECTYITDSDIYHSDHASKHILECGFAVHLNLRQLVCNIGLIYLHAPRNDKYNIAFYDNVQNRCPTSDVKIGLNNLNCTLGNILTSTN